MIEREYEREVKGKPYLAQIISKKDAQKVDLISKYTRNIRLLLEYTDELFILLKGFNDLIKINTKIDQYDLGEEVIRKANGRTITAFVMVRRLSSGDIKVWVFNRSIKSNFDTVEIEKI